VALNRLRNETQDLHRRVEDVLDILTVCADLRAYRAFLARALGYYEPVERMLARFAWQPAGLEFTPRRKVPLLLADLRALGLDAATLEQLGRCRSHPEPVSIAGALGVMYVLEGATLGGQLILRTVEAKLGLLPTQGAAFHGGYGPENGSRWRAFRACAEQHLAAPAACDEAVHLARQTFETYAAWMTAEQAPAQPVVGELERGLA